MSVRRHPGAPRDSCPVLASPVIGTLVHARQRMDRRTRLGGIQFFLELGCPLAAVEALMRALVPSRFAYVNDPERIVDILRRCAYRHVTLFHTRFDGRGTYRAVDNPPPEQRCSFLLPHLQLPVVFSCYAVTHLTVMKRTLDIALNPVRYAEDRD